MTDRTILLAHPSPDLYGSDRMLLESVRAFVERGWSTTVALPADGPLVPLLTDAGAHVSTVTTPVLRKAALRPSGWAGLVGEVGHGWSDGRLLLRSLRPDAVYVSTLTVPSWLALARSAGVPTVCHVHEAETAVPAVLRHALVEPLRLADTVLTNSEFTRHTLATVAAAVGRRSEVVLNGVIGPDVASDPRPALEGSVRLLYLGRLSPRKGVHVAVEAVARLRAGGIDATLDVAGDVFPGYEWYRTQLLDTVGSRGIGDAVRLRGFDPDVWPLLADADVVVVPSVADEPFGNVAVEAVLSRRPVVVAASGALPEAVRGFSSASVVPKEDPSALAAAVSTVVADWSTKRAAAIVDSETARERHAPQRYRQQVTDAVAAVIRDRAAA